MKITPIQKNYIFIVIMILVTSITYLNHFDNSFHFDDFHAINHNPNIRNLNNLPSFFKDGSTISSLPQNQTYRPIITTSLAIDYWLGNGYNPFFFHLSMFIAFLIQGIFLFFFSKKIISLTQKKSTSFYTAAGITLWYMLHPAIAETVNYIIARSDLLSTFFVVIAFVMYQYWEMGKKYHLYLIPIAIGALSKPTAIMFAPLLLCYIILFEEQVSFLQLVQKKHWNKTIVVLKKIVPAFLFCASLFVFHNQMTPDSFSTGSSKTFNYLITQPLSLCYYFFSSILPIHLSADTDWVMLENVWSVKFFFGLLFILGLLILMLYTSTKQKLTPISFGIAWFFISLIPTSSIIPLAEVMNDHRMFFPFIGLLITLGYAILLFSNYIQKKYKLQQKYILAGVAVLLICYAIGTYNRNEVWHDEESLWKDVTIKSPKNGRGLMNYGITQMGKGNYETAKKYFQKAIKYVPNYHTLYINLGILNNAQKNKNEAEKYFKKGLEYGRNYHTSWYYYGDFLSKNNKYEQANQHLLQALKISPKHLDSRFRLMENYLAMESWEDLQKTAQETLEIDKNNNKVKLFLLASVERISRLELKEREIDKNPSAQKYLDLSLEYYQKKRYQNCIESAQKALQINPEYPEAFNNICTSYNLLGDYKKAAIACKKALALKPDFQLAKNNLKEIQTREQNIINRIDILAENPTEENYLELSLAYFNYGLFEKCIMITSEGIEQFANSDKLYNNLCAAYNSLKLWQKGIEAGEKGLSINPDNQLLKNNYNWALQNQNRNTKS